MKRRAFLQFVGAFAASGAIPKTLAMEGICRAPEWWHGPIRLFRTSPLIAGYYTFTARCWKVTGEDLGIYCGGFEAKGGERFFEIPNGGELLEDPSIIRDGLYYELPQNGSIDFRTAKPLVSPTPVEAIWESL